ncbi:hypothetical protein [Aureispira anguillae]|uniref:Uncharacterized protein n=1 Tax=Aureispira anguillae TaxID=2864201 RepID=A0A915YIV6_9BACT|nr:hypothetical protein [Aureispira anguillae]BDS13994.1 hypothetical protein AsAng_0047570 [Aureispira anguillae]
MLFGAAALVFSISPAQATNTPQTVYGAGKYQMELSTVMGSDDRSSWFILVWDTETGRSKMYYGNVSDGTNSAANKFDLPSSPL